MATLTGRVLSVIDGDSFVLHVDKASETDGYGVPTIATIRLRRGDAAELRDRGGAAAKRRLEAQIGGRIVTVRTVARWHGRYIATVQVAAAAQPVGSRGRTRGSDAGAWAVLGASAAAMVIAVVTA